MNVGYGFLVETEAHALRAIEESCDGAEVRRLNYPFISSLMTYYISDKGRVWGCRRHNGFYHVTPLKITTRYKNGPVFRVSRGHQNLVEIYLAAALFNTFCMDHYDEDLQLEYLDGNPYNISLSNLRRKVPGVSTDFISNVKLFGDVYRRYFDRAVQFCLWYAGSRMSFDEAKDVASDAFYEMCGCDVRPDSAANLWLHICKHRSLDRNAYMSRFRPVLNDNGEEYLGVKPDFIDTGFWSHVKGAKSLEYLKWWASGETPTSVAEITKSTLSSVGSSITRSIQYLQMVYKNDIIIWKQRDRKYL